MTILEAVRVIMNMQRLPDYEVIIHIQYNSFGKKLEDEILSETRSYELDEATEYEERKDFHWSFWGRNYQQALPD